MDCHIYEVQFSKCFGMVDMEAHKTRFIEEVDNGSPSNRESRNLEQIGSDWNAFLWIQSRAQGFPVERYQIFRGAVKTPGRQTKGMQPCINPSCRGLSKEQI